MANTRNLMRKAPSKKRRRLSQQTTGNDFESSPFKTSLVGDILDSERMYQTLEADTLSKLEITLETLNSYRKRQQTQEGGGTSQPTTKQTEITTTNEKSSIDYIPGLVNSIILESSSIRGCRRTPAVTKMLVETVLNFVEPYLMETAAQGLSAQTQQQEQQQQKKSDDTMEGKTSDSNDAADKKIADDTKKRNRYRDRAVKWAVERLKDLLRPSFETDIPELDALLSATGSHDGLEHEMRVQRLLLSSIGMMQNAQCRNGGVVGEGNRDEGHEEIQRLLIERQSRLEDAMLECSGRGLQKANTSPLVQNNTTTQEIWSMFPEEWVATLQSDICGHSTGGQHEDFQPDVLHDDAITAFPFLGQMKDFLERHDKDDSINT
mmetsp:Transcript_23897/g.35686  ORF Transcript_23897/g.35686 Transcript_23897/m.35686 type:complete len:378 (+) Transcript_23897:30-1163(+)